MVAQVSCFVIGTKNSQAQGTHTTFGQNRVQFHDFDWTYYNSEYFTVYFYPGGQNLGKFIILFSENELKRVESRLDYRMKGTMDILVYNDITDLSQTNLGLNTDFFNTGGTTHILGNKIFVHFDGNHRNLYRDVKEGVSSLFIDAMMFGGSLQEILQNAVLLNLPAWFKPGLAAYIGENWNTDLDNQLRNYLLSNSDNDFTKLARGNPILAGQSMWHFISEAYGKDKIPNILYLSRINRSAENGFNYELGMSMDEIIGRWKEYYTRRFKEDLRSKDLPNPANNLTIKIRKRRTVGHPSISPDGSKLIYSIHDGGFFKVRSFDIETGKSKKILKGGFRSDKLSS